MRAPGGRCRHGRATASTALVPAQPVFAESERLALAGYLAGYRGLTREAYTLDLRQFTGVRGSAGRPSGRSWWTWDR